MPNWKHWVSLSLTTFAGAFMGYLSANLGGGLPDQDKWKSIAIGAAVAGVSALVHLYQEPPKPKDGAL